MFYKTYIMHLSLIGMLSGALCLLIPTGAFAQAGLEQTHTRGNLWETVTNDGVVGSLGAWDYVTSSPLGLYPGFSGYIHPIGGEQNAIDTYANANYHNFRSGVWIVARDLTIPNQDNRPVPAEYEVFMSGAQQVTYGIAEVRDPVVLRKNYIDSSGFDPRLPEEMTSSTWHTNTGITVTRRSYVWSYPNYSDFIIYDYVFKNTGQIVSTFTNQVVPDPGPFIQTLKDVYFVFHGGVSVSTKSQINFHTDLAAIQAGAFGWQTGSYHDYYYLSGDNTLAFSYNYNGGKEPTPFDPYPVKSNEAWKTRFGDELQSPAAFGWLALYADATGGGPRTSPTPDVLRIDVHKGGSFQGQDLDLERFTISNRPSKKVFYDFAQTPGLQEGYGNRGNRMNFYTYSYGPYTLAPGDSVRIVLAEIAGVMDYNEVIAGDPNGYFPDSTIAAIQRNAEFARKAVAWGLGATVDGMALAADAPEPPPGPQTDAVNASVGREQAAIAVTWDQRAETATIQDGAGGLFYDGAEDLDGYRIYRSTDFQYVNDTEPPALRGAAWTLIKDIPRSEFSQYFDADLGRYRFVDEEIDFGFRYGYYVAAYNADPRPWTSANGTRVADLGLLESGSYNRTTPAEAAAGPVSSFDIYVVPNPYVFGDPERSFGLNDPYRIEFRNLPERATVRIYTISGDLIRTLPHGPSPRGDLSGTRSWDQRSDSGMLVAPGLYIFQVESETEGLDNALVGKLMIIR